MPATHCKPFLFLFLRGTFQVKSVDYSANMFVMDRTEGIVERAVLIGAPVSVQGEMWELARKVR
jgi:hypothetical protein